MEKRTVLVYVGFINPVFSVNEGGLASLGVQLRSALSMGQSATVNYRVQNGSASNGRDFNGPSSGALGYNWWDTDQTIQFTTIADGFSSGDKDFDVYLTSASGATIDTSRNHAVVVIKDKDPTPRFSIAGPSFAVQESTYSAALTVTMSNPSGRDVWVDYETQDGTARAGRDYTRTSGRIGIAAFSRNLTQTISVPILDNSISDGDRTFSVVIKNASSGSTIDFSKSSATVTIRDNDPIPKLSVSGGFSPSVEEWAGSIPLTIAMSSPSSRDISVSYTTDDDTARAGRDYTRTSGTITIPAYSTALTQTVRVPITNNNVNDGDRRFAFRITGSTFSYSTIDFLKNSVTVTIRDDDPTPRLSVAGPLSTTVDEWSGSIPFTIAMSNPSSRDISVTYATQDGSARAGKDYTRTSGTITIPAYATTLTQTVRVPILDNNVSDGDRTFSLALSSPTYPYAVVDSLKSSVTVTIRDNDPTPRLSVAGPLSSRVAEEAGSVPFTVAMSNPSSRDISVTYATQDGTAKAGKDYTRTSGTITIPAYATTLTQTVRVPILDNNVSDGDRTFSLVLSFPTFPYAVLDALKSAAMVTIRDNEPLPGLSISDASPVREGDSSNRNAIFPVNLTGLTDRVVSVKYATADGTAKAGTDYTATSGTLTFLPRGTSQTISVPILNDSVNEGDETFSVILSSPVFAIIGRNQGSVVIQDDDPLPVVSIYDALPVKEVRGAVGNALFTIKLVGLTDQVVTVHYATADGTARAGVNYKSTSGDLTFPPNQTATQTIPVPILDDNIPADTKIFTVGLSGNVHVTIGRNPATGTIVDRDLALPDLVPISLTWNTQTGSVGLDLRYEVRYAPLTQDATVALYWANGDTFEKRTGAPFFSTVAQRTVGTSLPIHVSINGNWDNIPSDATHLVLKVDASDKVDEGPVGETNNVAAVAIPLAWGAKVPGKDAAERAAFLQKVKEIAAALGVNPNYLMTVIALESDGKFNPAYDNTVKVMIDGKLVDVRSVGLISFLGSTALDLLNKDLSRARLIELLTASGLTTPEIAGLHLPTGSFDDTPAGRGKAQDVILKLNGVAQLTLVELFLQRKLGPARRKIQSVRNNDGSPTNLGDLYALVWNYNLISSHDGDVLAFRNDRVHGWAYGAHFDMDGDGVMFNYEVRDYLRSVLAKGFLSGFSSASPGGLSSGSAPPTIKAQGSPSAVSTGHQVVTFQASRGQMLTIRVDVVDVLPGTTRYDDDSEVYFFSSDGRLLAENNDFEKSWQSRIDSFVIPSDGSYSVAVTTFDNRPIRDGKGILTGWEDDGGGNIRYDLHIELIDRPTADIADVSPDPRNSPVPSLGISFSTPVTGFDLADLKLTRDGTIVPLGGATLTTTDGAHWTLGNLKSATGTGGRYTLTLTAAGSGIVDYGGGPLAADASDSWVMDTTRPTITRVVPVTPDPRSTPVPTIDVVFSEPIAATSFTFAGLALTRNGTRVPLDGTVTTRLVSGSTYRISGLSPFTKPPGSYRLTVNGAGIQDLAGNLGSGSASDAWTSSGLTLSVTTPINEGQAATLTGTIANPPGQDFRVLIDWGDGSRQTLNLAAGTAPFSATHTYRDNNAAQSFSIKAQLLSAAADVVGSSAIRIGSTGDDRVYAMAADSSGQVFTAGVFHGTVDFDPGPGTSSLTDAGGGDIFVSKLDAAGRYAWARRIGNAFTESPTDLVIDASGNLLIAGYFQGTVDFDPGPGTAYLTSPGASYFVIKLDGNGDLLWARQVGVAPGAGWNIHLATDAAGNVFVTGPFTGTVDFDPGPGIARLSSAGDTDIFILKLDTAGNFGWVDRTGGTGQDQSQAIAVGDGGQIYLTGFFQNTVDFDPGPGTAPLSSTGDSDIFLVKLNAAGSYVWARALGGPLYDSGQDLVVDKSGNVFVTGGFQGTVDFDPGPATARLSSAGSLDIFVAKYNATGDYLWARGMGSAQGGSGDEGEAIALDSQGSVYITGRFSGAVDFNPGPGTSTLTAAGFFDAFVLKLNSSGNYVWAGGLGGSDLELPAALAVTPGGDVFAAGSFWGAGDFDPGPGTARLSSAGIADGYVVKLAQATVVDTMTTSITVHNVAPTVLAPPAVNIALNKMVLNTTTLAASGSFTDPGLNDTFTATVDYGDGTGTQPLKLNPNRTFNLNHTYPAKGTYTVTVKVTDDDRGVGRVAFQVVINVSTRSGNVASVEPDPGDRRISKVADELAEPGTRHEPIGIPAASDGEKPRAPRPLAVREDPMGSRLGEDLIELATAILVDQKRRGKRGSDRNGEILEDVP